MRRCLESKRRANHILWLKALTLVLLCDFALHPQVATRATRSIDTDVSLSQPLTVRWRYPSDSTLNLTPAADGERIYLPLGGGTLVSLRGRDGQFLWKSELGGEFSAAPAADEHAVYVASEEIISEGETHRAAGSVRAVGREAGVTLWRHSVSVPVRGALAVSQDKVFAGSSNGTVFALDKKTGNVIWLGQYGRAFSCQPVISGRSVYVGSEDGALFSLDEQNGKPKWRHSTSGPVRGPVSVVGDVVYFGSGDGYVYAVDESDGHLRWRSRTGAGVQAVAGVAGGLLVASLDNFVYLLSFNRGKRIWKRQLPGRISSQPLTNKDDALFTPLSSDTGVVLALHNGRQVNSLPTGLGSNTAASPILVAGTVLLTVEHGLLAFSQPAASASH